MKSKNINNFTYHLVTSRCLSDINAVLVIPLMIPKLKLSCRIIILTPPWHVSTCNTNLCIAPLTEEGGGHFVYWKSASCPGSHPTENRTCRNDLWAAFVLWGQSRSQSPRFFVNLNGHQKDRGLWERDCSEAFLTRGTLARVIAGTEICKWVTHSLVVDALRN